MRRAREESPSFALNCRPTLTLRGSSLAAGVCSRVCSALSWGLPAACPALLHEALVPGCPASSRALALRVHCYPLPSLPGSAPPGPSLCFQPHPNAPVDAPHVPGILTHASLLLLLGQKGPSCRAAQKPALLASADAVMALTTSETVPSHLAP